MSPKGLYIDENTNKWCVGDQLGAGACGAVHELLKSTREGSVKTEYVVKLVPYDSSNTKRKRKKTVEEKNADLLYHESNIYNNILNDLRGHMIPNIPIGPSNKVPRSFGELHGYRFLVMERMDRPLSDIASILHNSCNERTSFIPLGNIASQFVTIMETIHANNYVAVDVKRDNFMISTQSSSSSKRSTSSVNAVEANLANRLRMIDLGLLESFKCHADGRIKHRPDNYPGAEMVGTPAYASVNVLSGHTLSRRDDLEACGYIIAELILQVLYFDDENVDFSHLLPWTQSNVKCDNDILKQKESMMDDLSPCPGNRTKNAFWSAMKPKKLNDTCTNVLKSYFRYVTSLDYKSKPNYDEVRSIVSDLKLPRHLNSMKQKGLQTMTEPLPRATRKSNALKTRPIRDFATNIKKKNTKTESPALTDLSNSFSHKRNTRNSRRAASASASASAITDNAAFPTAYSSSESSDISFKPQRKRITRGITPTINILDCDEEDVKVAGNVGSGETTNIMADGNSAHADLRDGDASDAMSMAGTNDSADDFKSCKSSPEEGMEWEFINDTTNSDNLLATNMVGLPLSQDQSESIDKDLTINKLKKEVLLKNGCSEPQKEKDPSVSESLCLVLYCIQGPHVNETIFIRNTTLVGQGETFMIKAKGNKELYALENDETVSSTHIKVVLHRKEGKGKFMSLRVTDVSEKGFYTEINGKVMKKGGSGKQVFIGSKIQIGQCIFVVKKC